MTLLVEHHEWAVESVPVFNLFDQFGRVLTGKVSIVGGGNDDGPNATDTATVFDTVDLIEFKRLPVA